MKEKYRVAQLQQLDSQKTENLESEGSQLLKRLKQQSIDNKDINDKIVRQKTLQNDLVCIGFSSCKKKISYHLFFLCSIINVLYHFIDWFIYHRG